MSALDGLRAAAIDIAAAGDETSLRAAAAVDAAVDKLAVSIAAPVRLTHLQADMMDHAASEDTWINVSWLRMYAGRPPDCRETLAAIDGLVSAGLLEVYTPDIPSGDVRRLDDDVRLTPRARLMCAEAGRA